MTRLFSFKTNMAKIYFMLFKPKLKYTVISSNQIGIIPYAKCF